MCDIDSIKEERKELTEEEIQDIVEKICDLHIKEMDCQVELESDFIDADEKNSLHEDAYLAFLKMVKLGKKLTEEMFLKYGLDAIFDCTYEELEIPEFEDYVKQMN